MEDAEQERRSRLLAASAAAEARMIEDELAAEKDLRDAEAKLSKARKELDEVMKTVNRHQAKVDSARALLAAIQEQRATGPSF